ncbi:MAG: hypothetical protein AB1774_10620 [Bacillota bacterium]
MNIEQGINDLLQGKCRTVVKLLEKAVADIESLDPSIRDLVIAAIIRQAEVGPLLRPRGLGEPLGRNLAGIAKIKLRRHGMRIIYRPLEREDTVVMEVIAVGPRAGGEVYRIAGQRLLRHK